MPVIINNNNTTTTLQQHHNNVLPPLSLGAGQDNTTVATGDAVAGHELVHRAILTITRTIGTLHG
jgi:hypothetical protein